MRQRPRSGLKPLCAAISRPTPAARSGSSAACGERRSSPARFPSPANTARCLHILHFFLILQCTQLAASIMLCSTDISSLDIQYNLMTLTTFVFYFSTPNSFILLNILVSACSLGPVHTFQINNFISQCPSSGYISVGIQLGKRKHFALV